MKKRAVVLHGDSLEQLKRIPDNSVHAVVTDPPYGLGTKDPSADQILVYLRGGELSHGRDFMGKDWQIPPVVTWKECLRVLKPGGHLLSFAGTRTWDLIAMGIRVAGFQMRDTIAELGPQALLWLQGQGFPKTPGLLKPAFEPIIVARKPFRGTLEENITQHGVGRLDTDATRVETKDNLNGGAYAKAGARNSLPGDARTEAGQGMYAPGKKAATEYQQPTGRRPTNVVFVHSEGCTKNGVKSVKSNSHGGAGTRPGGFVNVGAASGTSEPCGPPYRNAEGTEEVVAYTCVPGCAVAELDQQSGVLKSGSLLAHHKRSVPRLGNGGVYGNDAGDPESHTAGRNFHGDSGGASRFFPQFLYTPKSSPKDRNSGMPPGEKNTHVSVKPIALMEWLVTLCGAPRNGIILDPFMGSGSTGVAALRSGFRVIGIEREQEYIDIARKRIAAELKDR